MSEPLALKDIHRREGSRQSKKEGLGSTGRGTKRNRSGGEGGGMNGWMVGYREGGKEGHLEGFVWGNMPATTRQPHHWFLSEARHRKREEENK